MKTKRVSTNKNLCLSSYYDDPDHPTGIVFLKFEHEDFKNFSLLKDLYIELTGKNLKKAEGNYYQIISKDPDFGQKLISEIENACNEHTVLAKDSGWNKFIKNYAIGWVIIELSRDKKELYNDGFWKIN